MLAHQASCMLNALVAAATACLTLSFVSCAAEANYGARGEYGPLLKRMSVPEALLMDLFQSSVLPCLEGAAASLSFDGSCAVCGVFVFKSSVLPCLQGAAAATV
jgi:hypothetical protein